MLRIDLDTIEMNTDVADGNGTKWYVVGDIDGWSGPAMRIATVDPTSRHGAVIAESLYGARSLILTGLAKSPNEAAFWTAYNLLLQKLGNTNANITLKVYETTTKRISVRRSAEPRISFSGVGTFTFELPLIAADPFKYNDTATTTAYGTVSNNGSYDTYPIVTLTSAVGSGSTLTLANPTYASGAQVVIIGALASGTVIDFGLKTVTDGSTDKYGQVQSSTSWWALKPGSNALTISGATANITYRDAWI